MTSALDGRSREFVAVDQESFLSCKELGFHFSWLGLDLGLLLY
uniref:Uncharacterized protein n=1 Tax=Manihot esculenta TaxID=3983 RepID=A0A2C9VEV1_MANES